MITSVEKPIRFAILIIASGLMLTACQTAREPQGPDQKALNSPTQPARFTPIPRAAPARTADRPRSWVQNRLGGIVQAFAPVGESRRSWRSVDAPPMDPTQFNPNRIR